MQPGCERRHDPFAKEPDLHPTLSQPLRNAISKSQGRDARKRPNQPDRCRTASCALRTTSSCARRPLNLASEVPIAIEGQRRPRRPATERRRGSPRVAPLVRANMATAAGPPACAGPAWPSRVRPWARASCAVGVLRIEAKRAVCCLDAHPRLRRPEALARLGHGPLGLSRVSRPPAGGIRPRRRDARLRWPAPPPAARDSEPRRDRGEPRHRPPSLPRARGPGRAATARVARARRRRRVAPRGSPGSGAGRPRGRRARSAAWTSANADSSVNATAQASAVASAVIPVGLAVPAPLRTSEEVTEPIGYASRATRSWVMSSRSRMVAAPSVRESTSTVTQKGVPISSWRR